MHEVQLSHLLYGALGGLLPRLKRDERECWCHSGPMLGQHSKSCNGAYVAYKLFQDVSQEDIDKTLELQQEV